MIIFNKAIALELINRGFLVTDIQAGSKDGKPVYEFEKTEEFERAFEEVLHGRKYIPLNLMRQEINLIIKCLGGQLTINILENNKAENAKINKLIDFLTKNLNSSKSETEIKKAEVDSESESVIEGEEDAV